MKRDSFLKIYFQLMGLLGLTIAVSVLTIGPWGAPVALAIATVKAILILQHFMRLKEAPPIVKMAVACSIFWLIFLFGLTATDYLTRS